jgi:hypothetical protein
MVLTIHINRWDISKILVDSGSQAEILFMSTLKKWAMTRSRSKNQQNSFMALAAKELSWSK